MVFVAGFFIVLGALVKYAKFYFLIAGYNTMSKKEQQTYDIEGIATVFRNGMWGMAFLILVSFLVSKMLANETILNIGFFVSIVIGVAYLLVVSNSGKFKK